MVNRLITANIKIKINSSSHTSNINKNKLIMLPINKMLQQNKLSQQALKVLRQMIKLIIRECKKIN
jgi:hypothetical protein